jgi:hypothetical protein
MPEEDDQAAVDLLEGLEREVRYALAALEGVEELRERRRHDPLLLDVQDEPARDQRRVVPLPVIDAGGAIAIKPKPVGPSLLVDKLRRTRRLQRLDKVGKRHGPGRMKLGHFFASAGKLARPKRFEFLTF